MEFELELNGVTMKVQELQIQQQTVYRVVFSSPRPPLVICQMKGMTEIKWTSIPEGRQKEAEGVGKLIEEYIKKNNH